jgi:hypothetical protein
MYEVGVFPSMTKGEIVGHIVIDVNRVQKNPV